MADDTVIFTRPSASMEEIQQEWHEVKSRVAQLEAERAALEQDNKNLRFLLERVIEHRQKSHGELVLLLSGLVSKLPINDVGVVVSKLVEHNAHVSEVCTLLAKGKAEAMLPQPSVLRALDQTKRDLIAAVKPTVEELIRLEVPLEVDLLRSFVTKHELFFSPAAVRANRCYVKGQVPRERIIREFAEAALIFFQDMTTDPKRNPRPKPEEIVLAFKTDFDAIFQQNPTVLGDKRPALQALHQRVQRSKAATPDARAQRSAFQKLTFILELLHYYENQETEAAEGVFAQRLPVLIEQLVVASPQDQLDEKLIVQAESLLGYVISLDHRLMVINNVGKAGAVGRTLKYVLRLRTEKAGDPSQTVRNEIVPEFVKHLVPLPPQQPSQAQLLAVLRLLQPDKQRMMVRGIMASDRLRREEADSLGRTLGKELGLAGLEEELHKASLATISPEVERQMAWENIKELIMRRAEPTAIAAAIRDRLRGKYDADEVKQSWITLIEAEPVTLIRTFSQLPYLSDGSTDPIARAVMESYVTRLTHEKYAATYHKIVNSLKNMFKANPNSPTLLNFINLVRWVDADASRKLGADIGMAAAH